MIKRPWQIWTLYGLCVLLVVPAMLWLSYMTWQLDRAREQDRAATENARRQAEIQERVSSALWRMDWLMIPLVAQEAARPYYMYEPFYREPEVSRGLRQVIETTPRPSPILTPPSEFIQLHFQIDPTNTFTSPQIPQGANRETAMVACGISDAAIDASQQRLDELKQVCDYQTMSVACPSENLPDANKVDFPWQANDIAAQVTRSMSSPKEQLLANSAPQIEQRLEQSELAAAEGQTADQFSGIDQKQQQQSSFRSSSEFLQRDKATQSYTKGQLNLNRFSEAETPETERPVTEGVMRPFWIGEFLVMARRVDLGDRVVIQGCWLNWDRIRETLCAEIKDVLPGADLMPASADASDDSPGRKLATLPVQLTNLEMSVVALGLPNPVPTAALGISGLKVSLALAWVGLILGLIAIAALLRGVLRLSERRAAFASAVTHELRTPLTTFRMYAEMLAEQMIPSAEKRQQYARTMKVEADRLGHLVENVLQYARLERRNIKTRAVRTSVGAMFDRFTHRLHERAAQAGMTLALEIDEPVWAATVETDPGTIEQIVFNLIDNACKYAASAEDKTIHLNVAVDETTGKSNAAGGKLRITVRDHGPGIDAQLSRRLFTAFSKSDQEAAETARGVGLGLALCRRMASDLGGSLVWDKQYTNGASFTLTLPC